MKWMNHVKLQWGNTLKYIGCLFQINSCRVDIRQQLRNVNTTEILTTSCQCMAKVETKSLRYTLSNVTVYLFWLMRVKFGSSSATCRQPSIIKLMFYRIIHSGAYSTVVGAKAHNWFTVLLWLPSNEILNSATDYIVLSAYIKRLKSDSSCFATTETGICLVFTG